MTINKKDLNNAAVENYRFKYVAVSDNAKTGKMSAVYTALKNNKCGSCPARCPFADMCYAKNGPCNIHWEETAKNSKTTIANLNETIKNGKKHKKILRHNVAGDIAIKGTSDINKELVEKLTDIYSENFDIAYSYTHCEISNKNIEIVKTAAKKNFVINFSTEKISDCKKCLAAGVNCVIAVNDMQEKVKTVDGVKIVKCPNSDNKDIKCLNCGLCYQKNRAFAVAFPVHGAKKEKAKKAGFLTDL